jgi:hypothetical protein
VNMQPQHRAVTNKPSALWSPFASMLAFYAGKLDALTLTVTGSYDFHVFPHPIRDSAFPCVLLT